jgi:hypothetical protein
MADVSGLMISHPEFTSFAQLEEAVVEAARGGEIHLYLDIQPEYPDTPKEWRQRLELVFSRAKR